MTATVPRLRTPRRRVGHSPYPLWFYIPAGVFYVALFLIPTGASLYFSLTRWTLFDSKFIGLANFVQFFNEPALVQGFINTFIYAFLTSGAKVVLGLLLGVLLSSQIMGRGFLRSVVFFPVLVSTIGIGITFKVLLDPFDGLVNNVLGVFGIEGPGWLTDPSLALLSVAWSISGKVLGSPPSSTSPEWSRSLRSTSRRPRSTVPMRGRTFATSPSRYCSQRRQQSFCCP